MQGYARELRFKLQISQQPKKKKKKLNTFLELAEQVIRQDSLNLRYFNCFLKKLTLQY